MGTAVDDSPRSATQAPFSSMRNFRIGVPTNEGTHGHISSLI